MRKTTVSIILPVYNEKESLPELFFSLEQVFKNQQSTTEYIVIDDGSTDGSFEELLIAQKRHKGNFKIIKFRKNSGKSAALAAGFNLASGEYIVTLDADLQDDPKEIPKMIEVIKEGFDLVVGWRENRNDPKNKIHLSHVFNGVVAKISGLRLHDTNCGLKVLTKTAAKEIRLYGELHRFVPFLVASKGFKVTEIPVVHHARKYGRSKFGTRRIFKAIFDLITTVFITSFNNQPMQIFGPTGALFFIAGLISLIYLSVLHFLGQSIYRRPLLELGILFMVFGVQIFSTGLIGELITSAREQRNQNINGEIIK